MWGNISGSSLTFLELHIQLADRLALLPWDKVQVWDSNVSVHEWQSKPDSALAFDVVPRKDVTSVSLIVRNPNALDSVRRTLETHGKEFSTIEGRPLANLLAEVPRPGVGVPHGHPEHIAKMIVEVRAILDT